MKKSIRLYLTGSVQGVFFRQYLKDKADKNKVKGYIRTLDDGRIEVFFEGIQEDVDLMIELCKSGHQYAKIRNVEQVPQSFQDFKEFKILRF